jgi:hypothetical protein
MFAFMFFDVWLHDDLITMQWVIAMDLIYGYGTTSLWRPGRHLIGVIPRVQHTLGAASLLDSLGFSQTLIQEP